MKQSRFFICLAVGLLSAISLAPSFGESGNNNPRATADSLYLEGTTLLVVDSNFAQAVVVFRQAIRTDSDYVLAYNALGKAYEKLHQWANAEAAYRIAVQLDTVYADAYFNLAEAVHNRGAASDAIHWLQKSLSFETDSIRVQKIELRLGQYLFRQGDMVGAAAIYRQVLRVDSINVEARLGLVNTTVSGVEARKELEQILEIDPSYSPAWSSLAEQLWMDSSFGNAIEASIRSIVFDSTSCAAYVKCLRFIDGYLKSIDAREIENFNAGMMRKLNQITFRRYTSRESMEHDQADEFDRFGKEYQQMLQQCRDSFFSQAYINLQERRYENMIFMTDYHATSYITVAKFFDALKQAVTELRSLVVAQARRIVPNCTLPELKFNEITISSK